MNSPVQIIFLVGPTAVGKSDVAILLAKKIKAEIVSCDSMQVYREVHIASNKPPTQDMKSVKHHLVDVVSVKDEFDVAAFNKMANQTIEDILSRGKIPLVTGGSGMYMQVLLDGIFEGASKDMQLREKLVAEAVQKGNDALYEKLKKLDPLAAEKIHPNNLKRLIRALEVCLGQNKKFSTLKQTRRGLWGKYAIRLFCLNQPRASLYEAINARVEKMFKIGLIEEIQSLLALPLSKTAKGIIGFKEMKDFLEGKISLDKAKENIKINTRRYAKRQLTWFRREKRLEWVDVNAFNAHKDLVDRIIERIKIS